MNERVCTSAVCKRRENMAHILNCSSSPSSIVFTSMGGSFTRGSKWTSGLSTTSSCEKGNKGDRLSSNRPYHTPAVHNTIICENINSEKSSSPLATCPSERAGYEATISFSCVPKRVAWVRGYHLLSTCPSERAGYEATISFSLVPKRAGWVRGYHLL